MSNRRIRTIAYWTATILGPSSFVIGGVLGLTQAQQTIEPMHHLGYPLYFGQLLGAWKLLGAFVITVPGLPRLKEWAYAGFFFDLTAAAYSHAAVRDGAGEIVTPLVFLGLVMASYALRPSASRCALAPTMEGSDSTARATTRMSSRTVGSFHRASKSGIAHPGPSTPTTATA
jgi:hypothetical protein